MNSTLLFLSTITVYSIIIMFYDIIDMRVDMISHMAPID